MSADNAAPTEADACKNCTAWKAPPVLTTEEAKRIERAGFGDPKGLCRFMPTPEYTAADHWCRQHERRLASQVEEIEEIAG
jgi:hypothetical protein